MNNFVELYVGALSPQQCAVAINDFNTLSKAGLSYKRQSNKTPVCKADQDDTSVSIYEILLQQAGNSGVMITEAVNRCVLDYCEKYEVGMFGGWRGGNSYPIASEGAKIQKTEPGQGYHIWHCEKNSGRNNNRVLSWILYLNDVEEGGETEFIHYSKRFRPMQGSLLVFPAHFTHVHRGNPPLSGTKYIATGWHQYINY